MLAKQWIRLLRIFFGHTACMQRNVERKEEDMRGRGVWCPRIWGKRTGEGGGEGVSRSDRNVKQSDWLMAGGWGTRAVGQDHHYRDHTTEPELSPGNTEDSDNRFPDLHKE